MPCVLYRTRGNSTTKSQTTEKNELKSMKNLKQSYNI